MARKGIELVRAVTARRRKNIRFPLRAFVTFCWDDRGGKVCQGKGESRNVSEQGVFVETLICPPFGSQTTLAIRIQRPENTSAQEIEFEGRVVRIEQHRKTAICAGFALETNEAYLADLETALRKPEGSGWR